MMPEEHRMVVSGKHIRVQKYFACTKGETSQSNTPLQLNMGIVRGAHDFAMIG